MSAREKKKKKKKLTVFFFSLPLSISSMLFTLCGSHCVDEQA